MTDTTAQPARTGEQKTIPVTVAYGDGIGPEIMEAVLRILEAADAPLRYDTIEIGKEVYEAGHSSGIAPEAWDTILRNKVMLKAPITTPQGKGYKSLNVTIRKALNLFANVRPAISYAPFVASQHPGMNLTIIRENEEDLYAGIEHRQTLDVVQTLKLVTRPGSARVIRYAFEHARAYGCRKVTCMTKDNIMKLGDGLFHQVFDEIAQEYPDLESEHQIIDIGAARLAALPEKFEVIVTLNLYGDILSDIASQVAGSVGLAGSANIGPNVAMFEAVHGSAPDIAGRRVANPSGLLMAATQMLVHVGRGAVAELINNAWLRTLEDGVHTADLYRPGLSSREVDTDLFTDAVIERLGEQPQYLRPVQFGTGGIQIAPVETPAAHKELVGVDVFLDWNEAGRDPDVLGKGIEAATVDGWKLTMISNRGIMVYPRGLPETYRADHWRCRFMPSGDAKVGGPVQFPDVLRLLHALHDAGYEVIKTEHLYTFDGQLGYSLGQGE